MKRYKDLVKKYAQKTHLDKIITPLITSRIILQIVGYLSLIFLPNPNYPLYKGNDWFFIPERFLDIWARWDTGWYYTIVTEGYSPNLDIQNNMSNIAFFPLYPLLIKVSSLFAIDFSTYRTLFVIFGLFVSNISFIIALFFSYKIMEFFKFSNTTKETVIWLVVLYPYSFFFSSVYSESVFLLFLVLTFYFCLKSNWLFASIAGALLTLTRPLGILVILPIGIRYFYVNNYKIKLMDLLYFSLIPVALGLFFLHSYFVTGDFFGSINNQLAWGKVIQMPWKTIFSPNYRRPIINDFDLAFTIIALILLIYNYFLRLPNPEWTFYSLALIISPLFYGVLQSNGRYSSVAISIYFSLGMLIEKNQTLRLPIYIGFAMIQAVLFAGWVRGYFIV